MYTTFKLYISFCIPSNLTPWPLLILYHLNERIICIINFFNEFFFRNKNEKFVFNVQILYFSMYFYLI